MKGTAEKQTMKTDQNPETASAENADQTNLSSGEAQPSPESQSPPPRAEQEASPAPVESQQAEAPSANAAEVAQTTLSAVSPTASRPDETGRLETCDTAGSAANECKAKGSRCLGSLRSSAFRPRSGRFI
jgi:hypothetical protein